MLIEVASAPNGTLLANKDGALTSAAILSCGRPPMPHAGHGNDSPELAEERAETDLFDPLIDLLLWRIANRNHVQARRQVQLFSGGKPSLTQ